MEQTDVASHRTQPKTKTHEVIRHKNEVRLVHRALQHLSWLLIALAAVAFGLLYWLSDGFRTEVAEMWNVLSSGDQEAIREYIRSFGAWAPFASVVLMVSQVVVAPVPASLIQLANGVVFGVVGGAVLNLIGQMAGATIAFSISRSLGRGVAERLAGRVDEHGVIENWIDRWGSGALLLVRMVPGMPSDFVSYLMGLTAMPMRRYLFFSFLGYIPQSIAYAWLGENASDYFWWIVLAGFGISAVIALIIWAIRRFRPGPSNRPLSAEPTRDTP